MNFHQPKLTQEELERTRTRPEEVRTFIYYRSIIRTNISSKVKDFSAELGEQTIKHIMHIKRCLVKHYKAANYSPIDYFEFVIDPDSFAKTVENMFHVSFLIKVSRYIQTVQSIVTRFF